MPRPDSTLPRQTARKLILKAYRHLERTTGRKQFSAAEVAEQVPEYAAGTISAHLCSFMADGKHHGMGYGEIERVGRAQYQLTEKGRSALQELLAASP